MGCKMIKFNKENLSTWLSTALVGNYWAGVSVDDLKAYKECSVTGDCFEEHLAEYLLANRNNTIEIYDAEEGDEDYTRHINLTDIENGFSLAKENDIDEMDLESADRVLQYVCFGEVIFG